MEIAASLMAPWIWIAAAVALAGLAWKAFVWLRAPVPLPMPLPPAPATWGGVALRMIREGIAFETLFRASRWTWLFGWIFHAALLLVLVRHLWLFSDPVPEWIGPLVGAGAWLSAVLLASLVGLLGRRLLVARVRYVSVPSDYLMLLLILLVAGSGAWLGHVDPASLGHARAFALGLVRLEARPLPFDPALWIHLGGAGLLIALLPFSKLLHAPGVFLTPTRRRPHPVTRRAAVRGDDREVAGRSKGR
ncbi:MAG: respiratory nitrate reductase subunit gamma [Immundisolibacterales bacterium]|nr:respiratory nitrate reductase subunit gamma [Immundisolibacterales bacterium]